MNDLHRHGIVALSLALCASGCVIRPKDFPDASKLPQTWQVDRTRVLAVRANPPEIEPGQTATFERLIGGPTQDTMTIWLACDARLLTDTVDQRR